MKTTRALTTALILLVAAFILTGCAAKNQTTALHTAAKSGTLSAAEQALAAGIDINAKDEYGRTALHLACGKSGSKVDMKLVTALIDAGAEVNAVANGGITPLITAVGQKNNAELIKLLHSQGAELELRNGRNLTALHTAVLENQDENVKALVEVGAEINPLGMMGYTPLLLACEDEKASGIALYLTEKGANPNMINESGYSPLLRACEKQPLELIELLLEKGANVNHTSGDRWTPLLITCYYRTDPAIVQTLLEHGAKVNVKSKTGANPLHYAATHSNSAEMVEMLVKAGTPVNVRVPSDKPDNIGYTALMMAAEKTENPGVIRALLKGGADPNMKGGDSGRNALHFAARNSDNAEVVQVLLEGGADPMIEDKLGYAPIDLVLDHMKDVQWWINNTTSMRQKYNEEMQQIIYKFALLGKQMPKERVDLAVDNFYKRQGNRDLFTQVIDEMMKMQLKGLVEEE